MNPDEVVVHVVDRQRSGVVLNLLGECICQAREAAVAHSDCEVLAFDVTGADMLRVRASFDGFLFDPDALGWTVAPVPLGVYCAVNLDEHGVVDIVSKSGLDSSQVRFQAVARQLHAVRESAGNVFHEQAGGFGISQSEHEGRNQFGIGIDSDPRPHIATNAALLDSLRRRVLLFAPDEAPQFIDLKAFTRQVGQVLVHVVRAGVSKIYQEFCNGIFGNPGHANRRADRAAFHQRANHLNLLGDWQLVHTYNYTSAHAKGQVENSIDISDLSDRIQACLSAVGSMS